ncbi:MAG: peroxiredoxin [Eubacteriales bacterium]|nr:peroxiredoxin [Eubacteriales bacterium]
MEHQVGMPLLGARFPELDVVTTHGNKKLPDDYKGKWFVLFSHPGDFTPVCTTEFVGFARYADDFKALDTELIGLSVDQVVSHLKWVEWINDNSDITIPFPVIGDELGLVSNKLGMIHTAKGTNTVRAVFIVDPNGILRLTMYYPQEAGRSIQEILRALKALQTADKYGVAAPENYPNNEWIGSDVIVPPAKTEEQMKQRKEAAERGEVTLKDWWFAHKPLDK